jgi:hypothetical protein
MAKGQTTKWQTTIYKTLHRKLRISEAVNIRTENTTVKRQNDKQQSIKPYTEN